MNRDRTTLCARQGNTCPSKNNCRRHTGLRNIETTEAALYVRRGAGDSACDMFIANHVITTFQPMCLKNGEKLT